VEGNHLRQFSIETLERVRVSGLLVLKLRSLFSLEGVQLSTEAFLQLFQECFAQSLVLVFLLLILHVFLNSSFFEVYEQSQLLNFVMQGLSFSLLLKFEGLHGFAFLPFKLGQLSLLPQLQSAVYVLLLLLSLL